MRIFRFQQLNAVSLVFAYWGASLSEPHLYFIVRYSVNVFINSICTYTAMTAHAHIAFNFYR